MQLYGSVGVRSANFLIADALIRARQGQIGLLESIYLTKSKTLYRSSITRQLEKI